MLWVLKITILVWQFFEHIKCTLYLLNKKTECKLITPSYLEAWCVSIFLHRFVIDHIYCYYFRLMTYSIGENQSCEAKG